MVSQLICHQLFWLEVRCNLHYHELGFEVWSYKSFWSCGIVWKIYLQLTALPENFLWHFFFLFLQEYTETVLYQKILNIGHLCELCFEMSWSVLTLWSIYIYIGCPRRNVPDFGRVFLMLKYTDITQNTYIQIWTVTEIMAREVWKFDSCYTRTDYQIHIKTGRNMWFL